MPFIAWIKTQHADQPEAQIWHDVGSCAPYYAATKPRGPMGHLFIASHELRPGEETLPIETLKQIYPAPVTKAEA